MKHVSKRNLFLQLALTLIGLQLAFTNCSPSNFSMNTNAGETANESLQPTKELNFSSHSDDLANSKYKPAVASSAINKKKWAKGRLLVTPREGLPEQESDKAFKENGGIKFKHRMRGPKALVYDLPDGIDEVQVMNKLKKDRRFKNVELDLLVTPDLTVTDPSYSQSWALAKIGATTAWDFSRGDGIVIAILDTGVDGNHPDLSTNIVPGWNMYDNNSNWSDVHGHGTQVAGVAAAVANNGKGSAGIAWNASIMPIRISMTDGRAYLSTMAQGIYWAADNGAKVANISFSGAAGSSTVQAAANYMKNKGGVVVVAAGNTGGALDYAASDALIVAAATDSSDKRPSWSSYGPFVDVAAPGVSVYTTLRGGGYGNASGTSFSSPVVAATAALMFAANGRISPADVDQLLKSTAVDLGTAGYDSYHGHGRINAAKAVEAAHYASNSADTQAPIISITTPSKDQVISGTVPIDMTYSDNKEVVKVELYVNGQQTLTDSQAPFAFSWNTTTLTNQAYNLSVRAYDAAGNVGTSSTVTVTVNNVIADTQAPTISITTPSKSQVVSGTVPINMNYSDNKEVVKVELYVNGIKTLTDSQAPFAFSWNTTTLTNQAYNLSARAYDAAGNVGTSSTVTVTVNNVVADTQAPTISITTPSKSQVVSGTVPIDMTYSDNKAVVKVELYVNGIKTLTDSQAPFAFSWNTTTLTNQAYNLSARAYDAAGNVGTSSTVTVTVNNVPADTQAPVVTIKNPSSGDTIKNRVVISASATDNIKVTLISVYINDVLSTSSNSSSINTSWNTRSLASGTTHTIRIEAKDAAGNIGTKVLQLKKK